MSDSIGMVFTDARLGLRPLSQDEGPPGLSCGMAFWSRQL